MNQELMNQIIKQLETPSLESVRLTQELKALQETTGTINKREEKYPIQVIFTKDHQPSWTITIKRLQKLDHLNNKNERSRR